MGACVSCMDVKISWRFPQYTTQFWKIFFLLLMNNLSKFKPTFLQLLTIAFVIWILNQRWEDLFRLLFSPGSRVSKAQRAWYIIVAQHLKLREYMNFPLLRDFGPPGPVPVALCRLVEQWNNLSFINFNFTLHRSIIFKSNYWTADQFLVALQISCYILLYTALTFFVWQNLSTYDYQILDKKWLNNYHILVVARHLCSIITQLTCGEQMLTAFQTEDQPWQWKAS